MNAPPPPHSPPDPAGPGLWRLCLHGPPRLVAGARSVALERKAAGVLAWLALRGPALRLRLAELLWPATPAEGARNNLRQLLFKLKRATDANLVDGAETLQLAPALAVEQAGDGTEGELLEGCSFDDCPDFADWLADARAAHGRQVAALRLKAADAALAAGDADRAQALARQLIADDELAEPAHLRLVQALYLRGDRAGALAAAARCEALLRDHLGAEPSSALRALVATVQSAQPGTGAGAPAAVAPVPVAVLRPPRLVGRARELALLTQAARSSRVALLSGEPGLGKSRLLAEAAGAGALTPVLGARPGDAAVPYAALARWLRVLHDRLPAAFDPLPAALARLLPERASTTHTPADGGADRLDLSVAVVQVLRRAAAAGLTGASFDDLHFADDASLELLQAVLDDDALRPLAWALARRPAEGSAALARLADALLDDDRLLPLALAPLDEAGVHELVASLGEPGLDADRLAPELYQRTGGNPMFVLETLKALVLAPASGALPGAALAGLPRPRSVAALIERRLKQLSPAALSLARVAALAGPDFDTPLAVHVLEVPLMQLADAWAELETAQVLRDQAFAHDLIYEATLATVPAPIARHARRAMAEFLVPRGGEPARIGEHWLAAGEPGEAAPHFVQAGRRAEAAARYAEARTLFERGASCHDLAGQAAQGFETRLALADLLMEAMRFDESQQALDEAMAGAATIDLRLRASMQQMHLMTRTVRHADAVTLGLRLLADDAVQEDATPHRLAELRWTAAMALVSDGRPAEALAHLQLAAPVLAASDQPQWRCWFHSQSAVARSMLGEINRAREAQGQAVEAARAVGRRRMIAGCLQNGATFATAGGHLVEALDLVDESTLLMAETGGDDVFSVFLRGQRARLLVWLGRYQEALEALEPLVDDASPLLPEDRARAGYALAELWSRLGQPARARRALAAAPNEPGASATCRRAALLTASELVWMDSRDGTGADVDAAVEAFAAQAASGTSAEHAELLRWRARPGHWSPAEAAARREQWAARGLEGHVVVADTLAARDAALAGRPAEAAARAALALAAQRKVLLVNVYRPWLHLELARAAEAADPALAERARREGAEWVHNVARYQLPEPLRDAFVQRNRINRELIALAAGGRR
jgi:DNA-binding SARP family transcriptional activator/tetratricopeptide (TPR) repeat protein